MTVKDTQPKEVKKKKATSKATEGLGGISERIAKRRAMKSIMRKDLEIEVMNNTNGKLFYRCPKTQSIIEMQGYGDMEVLTMEQLNAMKNSHRGILENFWMVIVDVYDEEVEIDDVLAHLRLDKLYNGIKFDSEIIDGLVVETDFEEFRDIISEMKPSLIIRVAERMKLLNMQGQFGDMYKMNFIADLIGRKEAFNQE